MIEISEAFTYEKQIKENLLNKQIIKIYQATNKHSFCWFSTSFDNMFDLLINKTITNAKGYGSFVDIILDETIISINDGISLIYANKLTSKYQLGLEFNDHTFLSFTIGLYGGIFVFNQSFSNKYYEINKYFVNPLKEEFDYDYFNDLFVQANKNMSCKAFLATEQRFPGIGNGCLQDILFIAKLNPKRKLNTLSQDELVLLYNSIKNVLKEMSINNGRDTETDLFGNHGKYKTILSKKTYKLPCIICNEAIVKENYLGGSIYYCPKCQKL